MTDKTDAELIAKAEHRAGYFADNGMTLDDGHELAIELASRLKSANEKLENTTTEIAILESQLRNANERNERTLPDALRWLCVRQHLRSFNLTMDGKSYYQLPLSSWPFNHGASSKEEWIDEARRKIDEEKEKDRVVAAEWAAKGEAKQNDN